MKHFARPPFTKALKHLSSAVTTVALAAITLAATPAAALTPAWISGTPEFGFSGEDRAAATGVSNPLDNPGESSDFPSWVDADGNLWMYQIPGDMWRYIPATNIWTRMSTVGGPQTSAGSNATAQATWYGEDGGLWMIDFVHFWRYDTQSNTWAIMGEFSTVLSATSPGHRNDPVTWTNQANDVYLFGGEYHPDHTYAYDMWKYDSSEGTWTKLSGDVPPQFNSSNLYVYGTRGVFHPDNHPSGDSLSSYAATWVDGAGNLWYYDDDVLWKYDVNLKQWAYMSGTTAFLGNPVYGTQGVPDAANSPGSWSSPLTWVGPDGNLWLFNTDLWKFDLTVSSWAWMGGPQGAEVTNAYVTLEVADPANWPAGRSAATTWTDPSGKFYLYGGGFLHNSTWSYDTFTAMWTYWKGANARFTLAVTGTPGVFDSANTPGREERGVSWADDLGNLWLLGSLNDNSGLWKFDTSLRQWAHKGHVTESPVYGALGVESADAHPGERTEPAIWEDEQGYMWMYGGAGYAVDGYGGLSDLWRFNPQSEQWAWMGGSQNKNVDSITDSPTGENTPGRRSDSAAWVDASGDLWLFGGSYSYIAPGYEGWFFPPVVIHYLNDLWRLDRETLKWNLVQADTRTLLAEASFFSNGYYGDSGDYGTLQQPSAANRPGTRTPAAAWTDEQGKFWMFGGYGYSAKAAGEPAVTPAYLNDLWKYDPVTGLWTWMSGSKTDNQVDSYGAPNLLDPGNMPGARSDVAAWQDGPTLLLYGGNASGGESSLLNAVWSYDTISNTWRWTSNSSQPIPFASYGTKGVPSESNFPGVRSSACAWTAADGSMWLYGGNGFAQWGRGVLDDMWMIKGPSDTPPPPTDGPELEAAWAPAEVKCKTNGKGITKCQVKAALMVTNSGQANAAKSMIRFYLSSDAALSTDDVELKGKKVGKLKPGKVKNAKVKLKLPASPSGNYLIAVLDADGSVAENNELNNTVVSLPLP